MTLPDPAEIPRMAEAARELLLSVAPGTDEMRDMLDAVIAACTVNGANHEARSEMSLLWGFVHLLATAYSLVLVNEADADGLIVPQVGD